MSFRFTPQALERAKRTMQAAICFEQHALEIAHACAEAELEESVIAVVRPDLTFDGIWIVPTAELISVFSPSDEEGWAMIFAPTESLDEVRTRCMTKVRLASQRWEALRLWTQRHT